MLEFNDTTETLVGEPLGAIKLYNNYYNTAIDNNYHSLVFEILLKFEDQ